MCRLIIMYDEANIQKKMSLVIYVTEDGCLGSNRMPMS